MPKFKIKENVIAAFKGDNISRITDPNVLVNVLFHGSSREQQDAVENDLFPWNRLPSLLTSQDLNSGAFHSLCNCAELWDYSAVNFNELLSFIQRMCDVEPEFGNDLKLSIEYLMESATTEHSKFGFVLPADFVEGVYSLIPLVNSKGSNSFSLLTWVRFLVYPGVSDEFRDKVGKERKKDIEAGFTNSGWMERGALNSLVWKDAPHYLMFLTFMHDPRREKKLFPFEVYTTEWRKGLIEGLQEKFSIENLENVPTEWLIELAVSLLSEKS